MADVTVAVHPLGPGAPATGGRSGRAVPDEHRGGGFLAAGLIGPGPLEADEGVPHGDRVTRRRQQLDHATAYGLGSSTTAFSVSTSTRTWFKVTCVAGCHPPRHHLGLGQALPQIGQAEPAQGVGGAHPARQRSTS